MSQLGLANFHERGTRDLSGGEKRRLGLVEAFATRPHLILANEQRAGLDKASKAGFLTRLLDYRRAFQGSAVTELLISHDLFMVGAFADRIGVLYAGHLVQESTAEVLLRPDNPNLHPYTELLLRAGELDLGGDDLPEEESGEGCSYWRFCHRRSQVACTFRHKRPENTSDEGGWSLCPYPVFKTPTTQTVPVSEPQAPCMPRTGETGH